MAKATRKVISALGTRDPSNTITPTAKAMSVAMGMPQPSRKRASSTSSTNSRAGTTMPPTAAMEGRAAARRSDSSPTRISRLISSPTTKKNKAMRPSLIQWWRDFSNTHSPNPTTTGVSSQWW